MPTMPVTASVLCCNRLARKSVPRAFCRLSNWMNWSGQISARCCCIQNVLRRWLTRAQGGQWLPQELQGRRENLRKARVSIEHQTERLTDAYLAGVVPLEEYKRRRQELEQRLEGLTAQMRQLEASASKHVELAGIAQSMEEFCQRVRSGLEQASVGQKRQLIELLIDRVVVTNEEVEIRYVIPTSTSSEQVRFCHLRSNYFQIERDQPVSHAVFLTVPSL